MKTTYLSMLCSVALLASASASAEQRAEKIRVDPGSDQAVVIVKADRVPEAHGIGFQLVLAPYDANSEVIGGSVFGGRETIKAKPKLFYDGYLAVAIKPGTYVLQEFSRQFMWSLCFNESTWQFSVKPGEALYLGDFDSVATLQELFDIAKATGRTETLYNTVHFFDDVSTPRLQAADAASLAKAQEMVRKHLPKVSSSVTAADLRPARFKVGSDMFGTTKVCGGFRSDKGRAD